MALQCTFAKISTCQNYSENVPNLWGTIELTRDSPGGGGGGGTPIWNRRGCSSEIFNLTPKGDHLGVAQAFC